MQAKGGLKLATQQALLAEGSIAHSPVEHALSLLRALYGPCKQLPLLFEAIKSRPELDSHAIAV
jgi:hypothetical protein